MSTTTTAARTTPTPQRETSRVSLARLVKVELRKLTDTRAGRWLFIIIGLITAAVLTIFLFAAAPRELTFENFVNAAGTPQGILLPILGILTVTSEWSQRTGLVTFTLEPRRSRVALAKFIAVVIFGVLIASLALALAAGATALAPSLQDGAGTFDNSGVIVRDSMIQQLLGVVQGLALGMLIMNTAGAIVTYFAIPIVWGVLTGTVDWFRRVGEWIDLNTTTMPLAVHEMAGDDWARLAVAASIWVGIPLFLGWVRLIRREVKSA